METMSQFLFFLGQDGDYLEWAAEGDSCTLKEFIITRKPCQVWLYFPIRRLMSKCKDIGVFHHFTISQMISWQETEKRCWSLIRWTEIAGRAPTVTSTIRSMEARVMFSVCRWGSHTPKKRTTRPVSQVLNRESSTEEIPYYTRLNMNRVEKTQKTWNALHI